MQQEVIEGFRISPRQRRLWFLHKRSAAYEAKCVVSLEGDLDKEALKASLAAVVSRHEILRTGFLCVDGVDVPLQVIAEQGEFDYSEMEIGELSRADQAAKIESLLSNNGSNGHPQLDSSRLQTRLIRISPRKHLLWLSLPSLCADRFTLENFVSEIKTLYEARLPDAAELQDVVQYADFSEWHNELLESDEAPEGRDFWSALEINANALPILPFGADGVAELDFSVRSITRPLSQSVTRGVEAACSTYGPEVFFLACWQILIWRLTSQAEFVIGSLSDGRKMEELKGSFGLFASYLPVHARLQEHFRFSEVLALTERSMKEARSWEEYSSVVWSGNGSAEDQVVEYLPIVFEYQERALVQEAAGVRFSIEGQYVCTDRFQVKLLVTRKEDDVESEILYDPACVSHSDAERLFEELATLVSSATASPEAAIGELELLGPKEREQLLVEWNRTERSFPEDRCLHQLFERTAAHRPEGVAVRCSEDVLSFGELNLRANRLARQLIARGVGTESIVGLCLERSVNLFVAVLATWKAGAAYAVLESWQPPLRLRSMLEDLAHPVVLSDATTTEVLSQAGVADLRLDLLWEAIARENGENLDLEVSPQNLAYTIFTSGSTGRPKGVLVQHRSVVNLATALEETVYAATDSPRRVGINASLSFDASVKQLVRLAWGSSVELLPEEVRPDGAELLRYTTARRVEALDVTPSQARLLLEAGFGEAERGGPRWMLVGGEALSPQQWSRLRSLESHRFFNVYGPTECTVDVTVCPIDAGSPSPRLGRPLSNVRVYVLDPRLELVPAGVSGELCVGGAGLARGYLGRPGRTAERFVANPYGTEPGERLYRSGDRVRYRADGELEYLGRLDWQVKVRGTRIELGEIESVLNAHPSVGGSVADVREGASGEPRLLAYVVANRSSSEVGSRYRLANGICIAHRNRNETEYLYEEIFTKSSYVRHGIRLRPGACVFDVGANIGMFSLFVNSRVPDARIYAFEPLAPLFESLRENAGLCRCEVELFPYGLAENETTARFSYYPRYTMMSGLEAYSDPSGEVEVVKRFLRNEQQQGVAGSGDLLDQAEELLAGRFEAQAQEVRLRRLSDVIRERGVERIDLLKIDVQRAELDVLRGLEPADFSKIDQLVMEVHDAPGSSSEGRLGEIESLLRAHGYEVVVEQDELLVGTDRYTLYAMREPWAEESSEPSSEAPWSARAVATQLSPDELRAHLREHLPEPMLPSAILVLDELPLTRNGKVDRSRLPAPEELSTQPQESSAPRTLFEEVLAQIWGEVLSLEHVGRDQNFFEHGGHSLLATQLIARVREAFQVELPLRALFEVPTVALLAERIESQRRRGLVASRPPLEPVARDGGPDGRPLPLSFAQQRLWFLDRLEPDNTAFNMPCSVVIRGPLDIARLEWSLNEVVRRHENLRASFDSVEGEPVLRLAAARNFPLPLVDLSGLPDAESELGALSNREAASPFDLSRGPLLRARLLRLADQEYVFLLNLHHIISDGWSMGILVRELSALYEARSMGRSSPLPELPIQYADYAHWQRQWLVGEVLEAQLEYWKRQLAGPLPLLELPMDRPRPELRSSRGARTSLALSAELSDALRALSRRRGATLFMTVLTAFKILLYRLSGQHDVIVGTPIAGRSSARTEDLIGFFLNTLVLRSDLSGEPTFEEALDRVREVALAAYAHQDLPFEKLVEELQPERDLSRTPLFQVMLNMLNLPRRELRAEQLSLDFSPPAEASSKYDLNLFVTDDESGIFFHAVYSPDLFDEARVAEMLAQLELLLSQVVERPQESIRSFSLRTPAAAEYLPAGEAPEIDWERPIHQEFVHQARRGPDRTAIVDRFGTWSYGHLDRRSNRLAHALRARGTGRFKVVAVYGTRSASLAACMLGILRAGAAFLILDPAYPALRLVDALRRSGAVGWLKLAPGPLPEELTVYLSEADLRLELDLSRAAPTGEFLADFPEADLDVETGPEDLAYIAFTSGSTGSPHGVLGTHRPLWHFFRWYRRSFSVDESDRFSLLSGLAHDPLLRDVFAPLCLGAALYVPDPDELNSPGYLASWMARKEVTVAHLTPATGELLIETPPPTEPAESALLPRLRYAFFGGEALKRSTVSRLCRQAESVRCVNLYGATETPQAMSFHEIPRGEWAKERELIPLGRGIEDVQLLLLGPSDQPAGIGELAEICVRTPYLSRGYLGDESLTEKRFVVNPASGDAADLIYRTGDLGRYLPGGEVEYVGRADRQLQIRGYRVEPAEIERILLESPEVHEAVVLVRDLETPARLVAYLVTGAAASAEVGSGLSNRELKELLGKRLPSYMIPSAFVSCERLPRTPSGKIDTRALPAPDRADSGLPEAFVAPRTSTEQRLALIWSELLGLEQVGIHDSFFALGGHSLLAARLIGRIRSHCGVDVPLRRLFQGPTVAQLAASIAEERDRAGREGTTALPPTLTPDREHRYEPFPLTDIQQAYWVGRNADMRLGNVASHRYLEVDTTELDLARFALAWQRLVKRHGMLRAFILPEGRQQILADVPPYRIPVIDLQGLPASAEVGALETLRRHLSHQVLKTDRWPLFAIHACRLQDGRTRLHLSFDYLLADAWSFRILSRDLSQLYENPAIALPALAISFRDYVLAQNAIRESELYQRSRDYWQSRISHLPAAPELPLARDVGSLRRPRFRRRTGRLDRQAWQKLKQQAQRAGVTAPGLVLAAFSEILAGWSRNPRFTLVVTLFNRLAIHPQVDEIVGDFTSTSLLEVDASGSDAFGPRARRIQEQLWRDLDHRYFSGVEVVRELGRVRGSAQVGALPVVFTSTLNLEDPGAPSSDPDLPGEIVYSVSQTPQVLLDHQVREEQGALRINWDAVDEIFPEGMLDEMLGSYLDLLSELATGEERWQRPRQVVPAAQLEVRSAVNATAGPLEERLLHDPFARQVAKRPHHPAVITSERRLSYRDLDRRATHLAHRLRQLGARPNELVAVVLEKGWEQVVATLAILRSGAAYLPIDPELPAARIHYLLEHAEARLALTRSRWRDVLGCPETVLPLCMETEEPGADEPERLEPLQGPGDLAYVIFTSGSTGLPKGVMIDHRAALNTVLDINRRFDVGPRDRILALSSLSFDLSVYDIFGSLAAGATIVVPDASLRQDPAHWAQLVAEHDVTVWNSVPALMEMLYEGVAPEAGERIASLRLAMLSGDWIAVSLTDRMKTLVPELQVVSLGGATEGAIWSIFHPIDEVDPDWQSIPYGRPLTNQRLHVFDDALEPRPDWVAGQLYIAGAGVALGYWRDPEKTAASFLRHPRTGERLYRTGDLARYRPDGTLEFLGREDSQVKVRGHRIELGEIEGNLEQCPAVSRGVVEAIGDPRADRRLVAFVIPAEEEAAPVREGQERHGDTETAGAIFPGPLENLELKLSQPGIREAGDRRQIRFDRPAVDEALLALYRERRSHRAFAEESVDLQRLAGLLGCLRQAELEEYALPKYRYPSAGSLYPVQAYVSVAEGRVEALPAGTYYYNPAEHSLVRTSTATVDPGTHAAVNRSMAAQAAFSIFLIARSSAIEPVYADRAHDFCLLEAGYMGQLLMTEAARHGLGLCPVGVLDFEAAAACFDPEEDQVFLHGMVGGRPAPVEVTNLAEDTRLASGPPSCPASVEEEVRTFLEARLPAYMIPAGIQVVESIPLTANGKIDHEALQLLEKRPAAEERGAGSPRTAIEEMVAGIWCEVLGIDRVALDENFFELGGNSIRATQIVLRVRRTFQVELPLRELFERPTVAQLAAALETSLGRAGAAQAPPLQAVARPGHRPLSFAQQRLWVLDQLEPGRAIYNVPTAMRLAGRLDIAALGSVFVEIFRRHEVLRSRLVVADAQAHQVLRPEPPPMPGLVDLSSLPPESGDAEARRLASEEARRSFDLEQGPWGRASFLRLDEENHLVLFTMHHIASDAWSIGVVVREVSALYPALLERRPSPLPALPIQYADFAGWQRSWLRGEVLEEQLDYWRRQLAGELPELRLPTDLEALHSGRYRGERRLFALPAELASELRELARRQGVTLFMTLLAAFETLLYRHSGQEHLLLGVANANRTPAETEALIGCFINLLLLRTELRGHRPFTELLNQVRDVALGAYAHQDVPFEMVMDQLRDRGAGERFEVRATFGMRNTPREKLELEGLEISPFEFEYELSRFALTLWMWETPEGLSASWTYDTRLFHAAGISRLQGNLETLLGSIVENPECDLDTLEIFSEEEKMAAVLEKKTRRDEGRSRFRNVKPKSIKLQK